MEIKDKVQRDPVAKLPMVKAYMRWALVAAEEEIGRSDLESILIKIGLERLANNYPSEDLKLSQDIHVSDYANLYIELLSYFGKNGKNKSIQLGRNSTKPALEKQGKLFNFASRTAIRLLPLSLQIKTVLESIQSDLEKIYRTGGYEVGVSIEDRDNRWAYIDESCALCAGKTANEPICWGWVGTLEESLNWLTGKQFEIHQVECRAAGASRCVWEISKTAKASLI